MSQVGTRPATSVCMYRKWEINLRCLKPLGCGGFWLLQHGPNGFGRCIGTKSTAELVYGDFCYTKAFNYFLGVNYVHLFIYHIWASSLVWKDLSHAKLDVFIALVLGVNPNFNESIQHFPWNVLQASRLLFPTILYRKLIGLVFFSGKPS